MGGAKGATSTPVRTYAKTSRMSALLLAMALFGTAVAADDAATSAAPAASPALEADPLFLDAKRLFGELEFEQAAFRFEQLGLRTDLPTADRAVVLMWLGTSQAKAGDLDSASRSYELALSFDLDAKSPVAVSPKVVRLIDAIRTKVAAQRAKGNTAPPSPSPSSPPPDETPADKRSDEDGTSDSNRAAAAAVDDDSQPAGTKDLQSGDSDSSEKRDASEDATEDGERVDSALPISPLAIGASAVAGVALLAAIGLGTVGAIDILAALDPKTTQVEALERYSRGIALSATAGASVVVVAIATTTLALTLLDDGE